MEKIEKIDVLEISQSMYDLLLELNTEIKKNIPYNDDLDILIQYNLIDWLPTRFPNYREIDSEHQDKLIIDCWLNLKGRQVLFENFGIE